MSNSCRKKSATGATLQKDVTVIYHTTAKVCRWFRKIKQKTRCTNVYFVDLTVNPEAVWKQFLSLVIRKNCFCDWQLKEIDKDTSISYYIKNSVTESLGCISCFKILMVWLKCGLWFSDYSYGWKELNQPKDPFNYIQNHRLTVLEPLVRWNLYQLDCSYQNNKIVVERSLVFAILPIKLILKHSIKLP